MNGKTWLWILLTVVLLGTAFLAFRALQVRTDRWAEKDAKRVLQIERLRQEASEAKTRSDSWLELAKETEVKRVALEKKLEESSRKVIARPKPVTMADCTQQLSDLDSHISLLTDSLSLANQENKALFAALENETVRADALEEAWKTENQRTVALQRQRKTDRRRTILLGIIGGLGAGGIGYAIGSVASH